MKRLLIILAILLFAASAFAATRELGLGWDANTEPDMDEYRLYVGTNPGGPYSSLGSVKHPTTEFFFSLTGTDKQTFFFVATAVDTDNNESGYSNEVSYTFPDISPPAPPQGLRAWLVRIVQAIIDFFSGHKLRLIS